MIFFTSELALWKKCDDWSPSTPKEPSTPPITSTYCSYSCAFYVLSTSTALCIFAGPQAGSCPECSGWASSTTGLLLHITQTEASPPTHSIIGVPHIFQSLKSHWCFSISFHFICLALLSPPNSPSLIRYCMSFSNLVPAATLIVISLHSFQPVLFLCFSPDWFGV